MRSLDTLVRYLVFSLVTVAGIVAAWLLFLGYPDTLTDLVGIVLAFVFVAVVIRVAGSIANSVAPRYNVAEVGVTGPITRTQDSGPLSSPPTGAPADAIVDQIEQADADSNVEALLVHLNTPGGEIVPSEDIKLAAEEFDGPTIAYATDTCASGGYEIASGCDEIWARDGTIVGSIGVIGSRVTAGDLLDRLGLEYEGLTAGEYKDAGVPLKDLEDHEREYLQGIIDDYYDQFVANVATRRELDESAIRDTEARVYLGEQAREEGLVDRLGRREDIEDELADRLDEEVTVEQFEPDVGIAQMVRGGAQQIAYSFGAGITAALTGEDNQFEFR